MKRVLGVVLLATGAFAAAWFLWWRPIDRELTERPGRSASQTPLAATESSVNVSAFIRYDSLGEALTKSTPSDMTADGRQNVCVDVTESVQKSVQETVGGDVGKLLGEAARIVTRVVTVDQVRHVCQDIDYKVHVHRDGPVAVSLAPSGTELRISIPISVSGEVGFSGDVAKILALDRKSFRGSITAFADTSIDVGADWCPAVQAKPDFVWRDKAQLEVAGRFWIDIDGPVGPRIKDSLRDAAQKVTQVITCEQFKAPVAKLWHDYSWALKDGRGVMGYANLSPRRVSFSGLKYEAEGIRAAIGISAVTEVTSASSALTARTLALPTLERIDATSNALKVAIPLRAGYDDLQVAATRLLSANEFSGPSPAGTAHVRISEVTVYPSDKRLVLGARFAARFDQRQADVNGWVYLIAEPQLDAATQRVRLTNIAFTRDVDNTLWSLVSGVFKNQIQSTLEEGALLDLGDHIKALRVRVRNDLAAAAGKDGVTVTLNDTFIGLNQINLSEEALEIAVGFEGTCDVTVDDVLKLKP